MIRSAVYIPTFLSGNAEGGSEWGTDGAGLAVRYGWYLAVIVSGLLLLALVKRKERKTLTPERVKQRCIILKRRLEETLSAAERSRNGFLTQARTGKLRSAAEEAMWSALRLVEERKDSVFDGVAGELDGIADLLSGAAEDAFEGREEAERTIREALAGVNRVIVRIDEIIEARKG